MANTKAPISYKNRFEALTDGVYVVSLTLLVTSLSLPSGALSESEFHEALLALIPKLLAWSCSLVVVLSNWIGFVGLSQYISNTNKPIFIFGAAQVFLITLVPFSTDLVGEHWQHPLSFFIYSANIWAISLCASLRIWYAHRSSNVRRDISDTTHLRLIEHSSNILMVATTLTLLLSYVLPGWNLIPYLLTKMGLLIRSQKLPS